MWYIQLQTDARNKNECIRETLTHTGMHTE